MTHDAIPFPEPPPSDRLTDVGARRRVGWTASDLQRLFEGCPKLGKRMMFALQRLLSLPRGPEGSLQITPTQFVSACIERLDGLHQMDALPEVRFATCSTKQAKALNNEAPNLAPLRSHMSWVHKPDTPLRGLLSTDMLLFVIGPKSGDVFAGRSSSNSQSQLPQRFYRASCANTACLDFIARPYDPSTRCGFVRSGTPTPDRRTPIPTPTTQRSGGRVPLVQRAGSALRARREVTRRWGRRWLWRLRGRIAPDLARYPSCHIPIGELGQHCTQLLAAQQRTAGRSAPDFPRNRFASHQGDVIDRSVVVAPADRLYGANDVHLVEVARLALQAGDLGLDGGYGEFSRGNKRHAPSPFATSKGCRCETVARPRALAPSELLYGLGAMAFQEPQSAPLKRARSAPNLSRLASRARRWRASWARLEGRCNGGP